VSADRDGTSAVLGAAGASFLVVVFLVEDPTALLAWFGCWIAAILCMVPAHRTGWT
jgi:hypothetical protein